jgi:hypothetical protein
MADAWHYRSKDERLIALSNAQASLYNWRLTTFPGVTGKGRSVGNGESCAVGEAEEQPGGLDLKRGERARAHLGRRVPDSGRCCRLAQGGTRRNFIKMINKESLV